ncbi:MAG TPA: Hsp20/alpha crystallin family protein [Tepidiformaceae bacterium]|jgi:HSP20 family protein|nr:Hsp20/alpha crystallin family protein [Candidatus Eisenbacteria bacterium]HEX6030179.1 Hsp20/alpha crystallin family protein [Tepidiformaceae bacterium]
MNRKGDEIVKALMPGNGLTVLRNEMDRLFDRIWEADLPERRLGEWTPVLDFSETKEFFFVKMEVPGMDPKDIKISLQDHILTISGDRKKDEEEKDERFYRIERSYGVFTRSIRLPFPVDEHKVNAVFKNGVLTIAIPKAESSKGIFVPIKTA